MKILIIGGGPAGASAARLLAKDFDVTLIQEKEWDKPCGGGVKSKIFEEFNIPKDIIKHKLNYVEMIYKNKKIKIDLKGDNLSIVLRKKFDKTLRNLAEKSGAKIFYGKFIGFEDKKAIIKINKEKILFEYDILIAADGVNSIVRKKTGLKPIPKILTHYARIDKQTETCKFYFDKKLGGDYYAWEFPHKEKTHIGTFHKNFENFIKYLNVNIKPKGYFIPSWQKEIKIQKNNIYFVGDAAGQVMPLSFEGIYYAMQSAKILSDSIKNNLNYEKEWNKRFGKEFKFMKFLEHLNKTSLRGFVVNLHKFKRIRNFSVNLWLGAKNV